MDGELECDCDGGCDRSRPWAAWKLVADSAVGGGGGGNVAEVGEVGYGKRYPSKGVRSPTWLNGWDGLCVSCDRGEVAASEAEVPVLVLEYVRLDSGGGLPLQLVLQTTRTPLPLDNEGDNTPPPVVPLPTFPPPELGARLVCRLPTPFKADPGVATGLIPASLAVLGKASRNAVE